MDRTSTARNEDSIQYKLGQQAGLILGGTTEGFINEAVDVVENPIRSALIAAGTIAGSVLLARFGAKSPGAAKTLASIGKTALGVDVTTRLGLTTFAAVDTWQNPENYESNRAVVAKALGAGIFDYAALGYLSKVGLKIADDQYGAKAAYERLHTIFGAPRSVGTPVLGIGAEGIPLASFKPNGAGSAELFQSTIKSSVHIGNELGQGSGFLVNKTRGLVATNYHVVVGSGSHELTLWNGSKATAHLVARDKLADIAILRVDNPRSLDWSPVKFGKSTELRTGSTLFSVGHPDGVKIPVLAEGKFTALLPRVHEQYPRSQPVLTLETKLPTVSGNSGSPIFNEKARLVGIVANSANDAISTSGPGVEQLSLVLKALRNLKPESGWVEVRSAVKIVGTGASARLATPMEITSTSHARDRIQLAASTLARWRKAEALRDFELPDPDPSASLDRLLTTATFSIANSAVSPIIDWTLRRH